MIDDGKIRISCLKDDRGPPSDEVIRFLCRRERRSWGGIAMPSVFAVLTLKASSNNVGWTAGKSAGFLSHQIATRAWKWKGSTPRGYGR